LFGLRRWLLRLWRGWFRLRRQRPGLGHRFNLDNPAINPLLAVLGGHRQGNLVGAGSAIDMGRAHPAGDSAVAKVPGKTDDGTAATGEAAIKDEFLAHQTLVRPIDDRLGRLSRRFNDGWLDHGRLRGRSRRIDLDHLHLAVAQALGVSYG
jgi:hypothetical protein